MQKIIVFLRDIVQSPSCIPIVLLVVGVALFAAVVFIALGPFWAPGVMVARADYLMQWVPGFINQVFQRSYYRKLCIKNAEKKEKKYIKYTDENLYVRKK
jgi:peptide methionine sulfoxide reductase MsrA